MKPIVFALTLLLITAAPLSAQPEGHGRKAKHRAMEELKLTDAQKDALSKIRMATKKDMIDIRADIQKKRIELQESNRSETPDRATFERLSRELADMQVRQKLLHFDAQQNMLQQLDEDQQKTFKKLQKHRKMTSRGGTPGRGRRPHDAPGR